jgi:diphosphomevalonate decarboxylase
MHMTAAATAPPIVYWNETTVRLVRRVPRLRSDDRLDAWFTIDAGPHVAVLTTAAHAAEVARRLMNVAGVASVAVLSPGPGVEILPEHLF